MDPMRSLNERCLAFLESVNDKAGAARLRACMRLRERLLAEQEEHPGQSVWGKPAGFIPSNHEGNQLDRRY